jgi:hypothetical protein
MKFGGMVWAVALVLSAGCEARSLGEPMDPARVQVALRAWEAAGNPVNPECNKERAGYLTLLVTSNAELNDLCPGQPSLMGCHIRSSAPGDTTHDSIIIDEALSPSDFDDTIEHELRHWLAGCAWGDTDEGHSNPRVWYPYHGHDVR